MRSVTLSTTHFLKKINRQTKIGFNNKLQLKGEISLLLMKRLCISESINYPACNMLVIICIPVDHNSIKKGHIFQYDFFPFICKTSLNRNKNIMAFLQGVSSLLFYWVKLEWDQAFSKQGESIGTYYVYSQSQCMHNKFSGMPIYLSGKLKMSNQFFDLLPIV